MATSPLPSSPSTSSGQAPPVAPPNFYAQAASAQPPASPATSPHAEDTAKFRKALEKLLTIFDKMEKLKPNGVDVSKKIKSVAQSLKDLRNEVFEGEEGEGGDETDTDLGDGKAAGGAGAGAAGAGAGAGGTASPPPVAPGGVAGTGA